MMTLMMTLMFDVVDVVTHNILIKTVILYLYSFCSLAFEKGCLLY